MLFIIYQERYLFFFLYRVTATVATDAIIKNPKIMIVAVCVESAVFTLPEYFEEGLSSGFSGLTGFPESQAHLELPVCRGIQADPESHLR